MEARQLTGSKLLPLLTTMIGRSVSKVKLEYGKTYASV